jgi:Mrp family chromosome partitioning ATPase
VIFVPLEKEFVMGRMFRVITEGSLDYPGNSTASTNSTHDADPFVGGSVPYIEVGGANPRFSLPRLTTTIEPVKPLPAPQPLPIPQPLPTRQTIQDEGYLSVAMHQIAPKPVAVPVQPTIHSSVVTYHHPEHAISREYYGLKDELRRQLGTEVGSKAVLFTSAASDNGTTTVLLNLAVALAKEQATRVLVIDADLDRPSSARKLGVSDVPGLSEVLGQTLPLAWGLQPTIVPKLQVLGAGKATAETLPLLSTDFPRLVVQLRQWFDWILIDGGVWGERPHRDATSPAYDGVYLVTRQAELDRPVFHQLRTQVAKHGGLLRGYITTRA